MLKTPSTATWAAACGWLHVTFYAFTGGTAACFLALYIFVERASAGRVLELAWACIGVSAVCMLAMTMISAITIDAAPSDSRPHTAP